MASPPSAIKVTLDPIWTLTGSRQMWSQLSVPLTAGEDVGRASPQEQDEDQNQKAATRCPPLTLLHLSLCHTLTLSTQTSPFCLCSWLPRKKQEKQKKQKQSHLRIQAARLAVNRALLLSFPDTWRFWTWLLLLFPRSVIVEGSAAAFFFFIPFSSSSC